MACLMNPGNWICGFRLITVCSTARRPPAHWRTWKLFCLGRSSTNAPAYPLNADDKLLVARHQFLQSIENSEFEGISRTVKFQVGVFASKKWVKKDEIPEELIVNREVYMRLDKQMGNQR